MHGSFQQNYCNACIDTSTPVLMNMGPLHYPEYDDICGNFKQRGGERQECSLHGMGLQNANPRAPRDM